MLELSVMAELSAALFAGAFRGTMLMLAAASTLNLSKVSPGDLCLHPPVMHNTW